MAGAMMALMNNNVAIAVPHPGSIYFPNTSSYITMSPGIAVGGTYQSPFTVEGWFYSGDGPGQNSGPVILSTDTGSGTSAYYKALTINCVSTTGPQIVVDSNGAAANTFGFTGSPNWQANAWYYVAVSRDVNGFIQVWLGKQGDATAAASTSGRFDCSANTSAWALTGLSNCIGAFVPAGRYSDSDYISGIRVTDTNLYPTTNSTIAIPTQSLGYVNGLRFLQSPSDLTDLSGNQTLSVVGTSSYSVTGPAIAVQPYTGYITSGLQLYYNPNDRLSYLGSGTTINSLAPTNLTGTMSNITFTNPYFTYNGTSGTISVADSSLLEPGAGDFSLEAWVYYSTITGSSRVILSKTNGGLAADWSYGIRTGANGGTYMEVGNGTSSVTTPSYTVSTGQWYHIVGVYTNVASKSLALYVNGVSQGSNSHSFTSVKDSTHPLYLGSFDGGATFGQWLNGRMGITRYYSSALTSAQVLQNFNANKSIYGL